MVVDDSRVIRNAASKMLGREFDVVTADDGAEAWEMLEYDTSIQVVFTDLTMPRLNGYELLRNIRTAADIGIQNLPVIIVTGVEDDEVARVRALELGATDFITKPFTTIDLVARARAHANYQRVTQQLRAQTTLDPLTGLANKAGFLDRLQQDMAYARRHEQTLALVRLEIEDFRALFLKHGKDSAERLLLHVSQLLRAHVRREDTAGRIGLGGFALSLPAGEQQGVEGMVSRLRAEVAEQSPDIVGEPIRLSAAVHRPQVELGPSAQDALDQCQAKLEAARDTGVHPPATEATATPAPMPAPIPAPPSAPPPPQPAATPAPAARPLRLDPLLDQIEQGNLQAAIEGLPLILNRLLPLLRLLNPAQRAKLIRFLQQSDSQ
jgi:diguanylate cyclase (GGDEF)-like protein